MKKLMTIILSMAMCFCLCGVNSKVKAESVSIGYSILIKNNAVYKKEYNTGTHVYDETALSSDDLQSLGIETNPNVTLITLSKDITCSEGNGVFIFINGNVEIKILNDITLKNTNGTGLVFNIDNGNATIKFTSDNHNTLRLDAGGGVILSDESNSQITIDNIKLVAYGRSNGYTTIDNVIFTKNSEAIFETEATNGNQAFRAKTSIQMPPNFSIKGTNNRNNKNELMSLVKNSYGKYYVSSNFTNANVANYVEVKPLPLEDGDMPYDDTNEYFYSSYTQGSATALTAHIGCEEYVNTPGKYVVTDGNVVLTEGTDYIASAGSLKITFQPSYLNSLSVGEHAFKIGINGSSNEYDIKFTVEEVPVVVSTPAYKDESCEAVIGPRWHWNEKTGTCVESYSVINTATK